MFCKYCHKKIPDDSIFCCYCGEDLGKYVETPRCKTFFSYTISSFTWVEEGDDDNPRVIPATVPGCDPPEWNPYIKETYESATYQYWHLFRHKNTDRIVLEITTDYTKPAAKYVAMDFCWLRKELLLLGKKALSEIYDYTLVCYFGGFKWTLLDYHGGNSLDHNKNVQNNFWLVYKREISKYEWPLQSFSALFTPKIKPIMDRDITDKVKQLWKAPGDLNFKIVDLKDRAGKNYSCPFINGHALSRKLRDVLTKRYGVDMNKDGVIPKAFFDEFVLSEVTSEEDAYVTSNLWYTVSAFAPPRSEDVIGAPE